MRCLQAFSCFSNIVTCLLLCTACGTNYWKEHLDVFKMARKYIGLWQACYFIEEGNYAGLPPFFQCDKDYLRPHLVEPPNWFIAIRVLMLLACIFSFFGLCIMSVALATDKHKKKGSRVAPAALVTLIGGICGTIAMTLFVMHENWNIAYNFDGKGEYFADYWWDEPSHSMINGVFFNIELWYRYSFGMGWGGCGMAVFTFVVAGLSDITRRFVNTNKPSYEDIDPIMLATYMDNGMLGENI